MAALARWIDELFPDPERGARLRAALLERFGDDDRPVDADRCREVEQVAHAFSRHFALEHVADGTLVPDDSPPGWPPQDAAEVAAKAGSVAQVARRPDGVGVLALAGLDTAHLAAPYLDAAFAHLQGARGLVLDLRANGGGDPATLTLVLDRLLGPVPVHVSDVVYRDRTRQWWTAGRPAGPTLPVAALIGPGTFSSGEALAYHLQSRSRATLVGAPTPGAADHITPVRVTPHVRAFLPEAYVRDAVSGSNWEGTGVQPDVPCADHEALCTAIRLLL